MSRRIEIELTSARPDGTWTWRAAGARQPKGVIEERLVPEGAKAGDVLRADADFEIDGIVILAVLPPKERHSPEADRLEIIGHPAPEGGVTTQLTGRSDRRGGDRRRDRDDRRSGRDEGRGGDDRRGPRRGGPARDSTERGERGQSEGRRERRPGGDERRERRPGGDDRRPGGDERRPRRERPAAEAGAGRESRPRREGDGARGGSEAGSRARSRRLNPANTHRAAALAELPPEQQPVAEQVLRGGIPAVRTAIHLERERATAEGRQAPNADALLAMAESLLPKLKAAEWRDRAEAAAKAPTDISLRDLRSVVAGADVARDEAGRELAATLRTALETRVTGLRTEWVNEITHHLDEGRVVRALRLSGRPPEPSARLTDEVSARLAEAASGAMTADAATDRWVALLESAAASPVRRSIKPAGFPETPGPDLLRAAHQHSARIPALVSILGIAIPPPPTARRPAPRGAAGQGRKGAATSGAAPTAGKPAAAQQTPAPAEKPAPADEPAGAAETPTAEPTRAAEAPVVEPTGATEAPTAPAEEPVAEPEAPAAAVAEATAAPAGTEEPTAGTEEPVVEPEAPAPAVAEAAAAPAAPEEPTAAPEEPTAAPEEPTEAAQDPAAPAGPAEENPTAGGDASASDSEPANH